MISSPGCDLVDVVERLTVRGAVPGDGGVAELAGQRGVGVVAGTLLQVGLLDTRDDVVVDADGRDLEPGDHVALLERRQVLRLRRYRRRGRRRRVRTRAWLLAPSRRGEGRPCRGSTGTVVAGSVETTGTVLASNSSKSSSNAFCAAGGLDAGAPQLVGDEPEHQQAGGDEDLAEPADPEPPVLGLRRAVPLAGFRLRAVCRAPVSGPSVVVSRTAIRGDATGEHRRPERDRP